jgi:FkbM family methyltransferase
VPLPRDWFRRYVWRRDLVGKARERGRGAHRRLTRTGLTDLARLFQHRSPTVVFDVGANVGYETDRYLRAFPDAVVHAVEPSPASFARLEAAYRSHPRVRLHAAAATDAAGAVELQVDEHTFGGGADSLLHHTDRFLADQPAAAYAAVSVAGLRLDDLAADEGVDHVDVLKLDVEGAELLALAGAERLLATQSVDALEIEVRVLADYEGQPLLADVVAHLADRGYRLFGIHDLAEAPSGQLLWANAVFLSDRFRDELAEHHPHGWTRF